MKVIDNFLPQYQFKQLQSIMMVDDFPWFFNGDGLSRLLGEVTWHAERGVKRGWLVMFFFYPENCATLFLKKVAKEYFGQRQRVSLKSKHT